MVSLSPQQSSAVMKAGEWFKYESGEQQVFTLEGFAGTGKSTILPDIISATGLQPHQIAFCAPTGKAAKVMGEKLRAQGIERPPSTIHGLIYTPKQQKAETLERELNAAKEEYVLVKGEAVTPPNGDKKSYLKELDRKIAILTKDLDRAYDIDDLRFTLNFDSVLVKETIKLIICDEASMVGAEVAEDMMSFEVPILAIGDPGQLPPVGDKPGFLVGSADALLTEVHRQAAENPIIHIATMVRKGQRADFGDYGNGVLIVPRKEDIYTLDLSRDAQIIVGTNKTRWKITSKLRKAAGIETNLPTKGEPLIMCKNSRQHGTLVNGTQVWSDADHGDAEDGSSRFLIRIREENGNPLSMFAYQGCSRNTSSARRTSQRRPSRQPTAPASTTTTWTSAGRSPATKAKVPNGMMSSSTTNPAPSGRLPISGSTPPSPAPPSGS
jgi:exodeoxyribonuclease-5